MSQGFSIQGFIQALIKSARNCNTLGRWGRTSMSPHKIFFIHLLFNALKVPESVQYLLYPSLSPVNTFRVVFSSLTEQPFNLIKDKYYLGHLGQVEPVPWPNIHLKEFN